MSAMTTADERRAGDLRDLAGSFDVLVIGGGATGLGIALDAATRGFRTALVEAGDFAQATSSRSTKLIHGGVRYLASGQMHLVYEALHERAVLKHNAPHLVEALPLVVPTYSRIQLPYLGAGLVAYNLLSGRASMGPTRLLGPEATAERVPGIARGGLRGSVLYYDAQFNDARLALAVARSAKAAGAVVMNYARCVGLLRAEGKVAGAVVKDMETGAEMEVRAGVVINATGIFVDEVRRFDEPKRPSLLSVSRGSHVVVDRSVLGGESAIMVPKTADGRVIFAIPWQGQVVIGTTDIPVSGSEMEPGYADAEIEYLLKHINPYLQRKLGPGDVLSVFSGLRPLVTGAGSTTSKLSREHHIDASEGGLVTIAGGKWTTYRRMAEDALDFAAARGLLQKRACTTRTVALHGAREGGAGAGILREYGTDADEIQRLTASSPELGERIDAALPYTGAMVVFAVRHEMARTLEDVLSRRTRALLLNAEAAVRSAPGVARLMAAELGRDGAWVAGEVRAFGELAKSFYRLRAEELVAG